MHNGPSQVNPKLVRESLEELSDIQVEFFTGLLPSAGDLLVVKCSGECGYGSGSNDDCTFMAAMTKAGLEAFSPSILIFDFRQLRYEWGDQMLRVLAAGDGQFIDQPFPTAVVVSDLCREGLSSLVRDEMFGEKVEDWLFDSLSDAVQVVDRWYADRIEPPPDIATDPAET